MAIVFESGTERLTFSDIGVWSELRYIPTSQTFSLTSSHHNWSNQDSTPDYPNSISEATVSSGVKDVTYTYDTGKTSVVRVTSHDDFLEFELRSTTGDLGRIMLLYCGINGLRDSNIYFSPRKNLFDIDNGYFAVFVPAVWESRVWQIRGADYQAVYTESEASITPHPSYSRNQRFAFFICLKADLVSRLQTVEAYFDMPYASLVKDEADNEKDYLFLLSQDSASNQDVIDLCAAAGLTNILLHESIWWDYTDDAAPYVLTSGASALVSALQAASLSVGLHVQAHKPRDGGYWHTNYPTQVSANVESGFRCFLWNDTLPETAAAALASAFNGLGADWLYFDRCEELWETGGSHVTTWDQYLKSRFLKSVLQACEDLSKMPTQVQRSSSGYSCYFFGSRIGQTDYWDDKPSPQSSPTETINWGATHADYHRDAGCAPDLGWFGRQVHVYPTGDRDMTWAEWCLMADTAVESNIVVGIRTTWNDFDTDTNRDAIKLLLEAATAHRNGATWHGYLGVQNINLASGDWTSLKSSCQAFGPSSHWMPARLNHWIELGNNTIYEAQFDGLDVAIFNFRQMIADLLSVTRSDVTYTVTSQTYDTNPSTKVTFTYSATNYLTLVFLGGPATAWADSWTECVAFRATW